MSDNPEWKSNRVTTGRRVQCQQELCPNFHKTWVLKPEPFFEPGKLKSELHTWPDVRCNGCECQPIFVGFIEGPVPT